MQAAFAAATAISVCVWAHAAPDGAGAMRGPSVADGEEEATLVARGFQGEILPLPVPPAIAALDLIELDDATERKVQELLADRARVVDEIVLGNIELLSQIETVMAVGRPAEKFEIIREGLIALGPAREWGRLEDRLAAVLPEARRERYVSLIEEYERASWTAAKAAGEVDRAFEHRMARYWADMTWEIERAAERVFDDDGEGDAWLEKLTKGLGLTPDQVGEIRAMGERFYIESKGRPSQEDQLRFIARIRGVMTLEQRWKLTGMMLRGELERDEGME